MRLAGALTRHAHEFVTLQTVQSMLEQLEGPYPATVQEVVPKLLGVQALTEILQRLVEEGISIRNLSKILHVLAERAQKENDPLVLTESVREGLSRYITHRWSGASGQLVAYVVDRAIEDQVAGAVRHTDSGAYLALTPDVTREILQAIEAEVRRDVDAGRTPVLLTDQRARRYIKKLADIQIPEVVVLAYQELEPALRIEPIARISVGR
jgi:type III secretion protein V